MLTKITVYDLWIADTGLIIYYSKIHKWFNNLKIRDFVIVS